MPIHDWNKVDTKLFHHFYQQWTIFLSNGLNNSVLPKNYFALIEQRVQGPIPDVLTLKIAPGESTEPENGEVGIDVAACPPKTKLVFRNDQDIYAAKANRITIRHKHGDVVAVLEIVSPGNKGSRADIRSFVEKSVELITNGIHLMVIDLFPPGPRDPQGLHKVIWDEFQEESLELTNEKPLTLASYDAGPPRIA